MRRVLNQSYPFVSEKSETIYRLIEEGGKRFIEKVTTSTTREQEIPDTEDAGEVFSQLLAKKKTNRERSKSRISTQDAFIRHHVHEDSWRKIADEVGQRSSESISSRVSVFTADLAKQYMLGENLTSMAEKLQMSPNHLHMILADSLSRSRRRLLSDFESKHVMRGFPGDVEQIVRITNFLDDWDDFEYQVVSPFEEGQGISPLKKVLFTENFYEIHRKSGAISRVSDEVFEGLPYENWNKSSLIEALGLTTSDPVEVVYDMFGEPCNYYTDLLSDHGGAGAAD